MQIRWKVLATVNGVLILLSALYVFASQAWDRRDLLRIESRNLEGLAALLRDVCYADGQPRPCLARMIDVFSQIQPGLEIMVIDGDSVVHASSVAARVGDRWHEPEIEAALRQGKASGFKAKDHFHGDVAMLDVTLPVLDAAGRGTYAIHVARRMDLVEQLMRTHRLRHTLWSLITVLLIGLVVNVITYRWLIRPIDRITEVLASSRWYQAPGQDGDELQRLRDSVRALVVDAEQSVQEKEGLLAQVQGFNDKLAAEIAQVRAELTQAQAELVRRERFAALGEMAAGLAHELRNPLHIIRGAAELLARRTDSAMACQDVLEEVDRIDRFVNDLLDYTRPSAPQPETVAVIPLARAAVEAVQRAHGDEAFAFLVDGDESLGVVVAPEHLRQILVNLVSNGAEAYPGPGEVRVSARQLDGQVCLQVADSGRGIDADDLERVFEPFFTRRPAGVGLGLAIVRRLVDLYQGSIEVASTPGAGTTVTVCLPQAALTHEARG